MVQRVVKLHAKLKTTFPGGPIECQGFRKGHIQVRLSWTIHNAGSAIPKGSADPVSANNRRGRKAGRVEIRI